MLVLPAEITNKQARAYAVALQQSLLAVEGPQVVVDASAMVKFDSSVLAVLLQCRREALGLVEGDFTNRADDVKICPAQCGKRTDNGQSEDNGHRCGS